MNQLLAATVVLLVGALLALLPVKNSWRAACGLVSQIVASVLTCIAVGPVPFRRDQPHEITAGLSSLCDGEQRRRLLGVH